MFNKGIIRKFMFLSLGFGFIIGMIFSIVASFFTEYKSMEHEIFFTILCVVAGLMVGIISYLMAHITIIRAVRKLYKHFDNISNGDLTGRIYIEGEDDISKLTKDFNLMSESLKEMIVGITDESNKILKYSDKTKSDTEDLNLEVEYISEKTQSISAVSEETSAATIEIKSTFDKIHNLIEMISNESSDGIKIVNQIGNKANNLKNNAIESRENVEKIYNGTNIKLVEAIEESKAVEEIRVLSQSYNEDSKVVSEIIKKFNSQANELFENIQMTAESLNEISTANEQAANANFEISEKMFDVSESTNDVNIISVEVMSSSKKLTSLVDKFKV